MGSFDLFLGIGTIVLLFHCVGMQQALKQDEKNAVKKVTQILFFRTSAGMLS